MGLYLCSQDKQDLIHRILFANDPNIPNNTFRIRTIHVSQNIHFLVFRMAFSIQNRLPEEIDPYCGYDPKILACDGTHIGVSLRHLQLDNQVTKADTDEKVPWVHGRVTR